MTNQINLDEYEDLTDSFYRRGSLKSYIDDKVNSENSQQQKIKVKIRLGDNGYSELKVGEKSNLKDFSIIDDLIFIVCQPFSYTFEDLKFNNLTIIYDKNSANSEPCFDFKNCSFYEKINFDFVKKNSPNIIIQIINDNKVEDISINLNGEICSQVRITLTLKNYNLINSNFECSVNLKKDPNQMVPEEIHIKGCSFNQPLYIYGSGNFIFDGAVKKNKLYWLSLIDDCNIDLKNCKENINHISVARNNKNTIKLNRCNSVNKITTNRNTTLIVNDELAQKIIADKDHESNVRFNNEMLKFLKKFNRKQKFIKNSPDQFYSTKIENIEIAEGLNFLHLVDCHIENSSFVGKFMEGFIMERVKFKKAPTIGNIEFSNCNVEIRAVEFADKTTGKASGGFRALNQTCHKANYEMGVIFFHGLELESRYNSHLKNIDFTHHDFPEKILSYLNKKFTDYGRNLILPFYYLFALTSGFFMLVFITEYPLENRIILFKISIQNFLGPLEYLLGKDFLEPDLLKKLSGNIKLLSFVNKLFSYGIWTIWFFMIRRRFKI